MKWLLSCCATFFGLLLFAPPVFCVGQTERATIDSIVYSVGSQNKEKITFRLSAQVDPKTFTLEGDNPRLVMDFPNTYYSGQKKIVVLKGKLATSLRIGVHQTPKQKTRVVVDLSKIGKINYSLKYVEGRILTVTLQALRDKGVEINRSVNPVKAGPVTPSPKKREVVAATPKRVVPTPVVKKEKKRVVVKNEPVLNEPAVTESVTPAILDITFDDSSNRGEMVLFHLNDFFPPSVSAVEKDRPSVQCDFSQMTLGKDVKREIAADGKYVERIRTTYNKNSDSVRVVLDLLPGRDYDLQQVFFKKDNLFVLIINELSPE